MPGAGVSAATISALPAPSTTPANTGASPLRAEGDAQREREHQREHDDPEHRLRLADELPQPRERQLDERVEDAVTHRAGASRVRHEHVLERGLVRGELRQLEPLRSSSASSAG